MKPNQSLLIQLVNAKGEPLELRGVVVDIKFFVKQCFRYAFGAGKTDSSGQLLVTYKRMESYRQENASRYLMDYNTRLDDCDSRVQLDLPSSVEMNKRRETAYQAPSSMTPPLSEFSSSLKSAVAPVDVELKDELTRVNIVCC